MKKLITITLLAAVLCLSACAGFKDESGLCDKKGAQQNYPFTCGPHG